MKRRYVMIVDTRRFEKSVAKSQCLKFHWDNPLRAVYQICKAVGERILCVRRYRLHRAGVARLRYPQLSMAQVDEDRLENARQDHDRESPANHDDRERFLRLCADSRGNRHREQTERVDQIGHHGGAKASIGSEHDRL